MVHNGNLLLRGWYVSDVSFYTFEVPVDGLVAAVDGLRTEVVHVAAAFEYALLVLFAGLLAAGAARDRRSGGREGLIRALVAAGVMLTPGTWEGSGILLGAPDHIGVGVPVLITLLVVDRVRPRRWSLAVGTAAAGRRAACLGAARRSRRHVQLRPAARGCLRSVGGGVRNRRCRPVARRLGSPTARPPAGPPRRPARHGAESPGYDAALAVFAAVSYGVTQLLIRAIQNVGGYYLHAIQGASQLSGWSTISAQIQTEAENALILFGANFWVGSQPQTAFAYLHLVCVAVALLGLLIAIVRWHRADRVTRALVVGILIMLVAGATSPLMIPLGGTHEIAIVLPLGAALGGRVIGPWLAVRWQPRTGRPGADSCQGPSAQGPEVSPGGVVRAGNGGLRARRRRARPGVRPRLRRRAAGRRLH